MRRQAGDEAGLRSGESLADVLAMDAEEAPALPTGAERRSQLVSKAEWLHLAVDSGRAVGIEVTIFNPALDRDGSIAPTLVSCLARGLTAGDSRQPRHLRRQHL